MSTVEHVPQPDWLVRAQMHLNGCALSDLGGSCDACLFATMAIRNYARTDRAPTAVRLTGMANFCGGASYEPSPEGEVVAYPDHAALEAECGKLRAKLDEIKTYLAPETEMGVAKAIAPVLAILDRAD